MRRSGIWIPIATPTVQKYADVYEWFTREVFFERQSGWQDHKTVTKYTHVDYKEFLEKEFGITLNL